MASTDAPDGFVAAFAAAGGVVAADLHVRCPARGVRGVFVRRAAGVPRPGTPLFRVPAHMAITVDTAMRSDIVRRCCALLDAPDVASDAVALALFIATERAIGRASPWRWYIEALPRAGAGALFFGESDLAALRGTPLGVAAEAKERQLQRHFRCMAAALEQWLLEYRGSCRAVSFEDYKWAYSMVLSRSVSLPSPGQPGCDLQALLPLFDMANHSSTPSAHWIPEPDGSVSICAGDMFIPNGTDDPTMAEICVSYGRKPNTEWLYEYGFIPTTNGSDAWPYLAHLSGSPQLVHIKTMWMHELGLPRQVLIADPDGCDDGTGERELLPRSALLTLSLAALDDISDACTRAVGDVRPDHPYFSVADILVDDDDKLLNVPGLRALSLDTCGADLSEAAASMRAALGEFPCASQPVRAYLA
ncbi:hypothetical protein H4R21_000753, partial [Coemansia helicoidea]